jgi:hypothetical protein
MPEPIPAAMPESVPTSDPASESDAETDPEDESVSKPEHIPGLPQEQDPDGQTAEEDVTVHKPYGIIEVIKNVLQTAIPVTAATVVTGGSGYAIFIWYRKRKQIAGSILTADGSYAVDYVVTLEGRNAKRVVTDKRGRYRVKGLKNDITHMKVYDTSGQMILELVINLNQTDEDDTFTILSSRCRHVDYSFAYKKYQVHIVE